MKYRQLTSAGDYTIGGGLSSFYVNNPQAVAQLVMTRLKLWSGEWFLDTADGTNWLGEVLGNRTAGIRDSVVKARILATTGVNSILQYSSVMNTNTRTFTINVTLDTIYGITPLFEIPLPVSGLNPAS